MLAAALLALLCIEFALVRNTLAVDLSSCYNAGLYLAKTWTSKKAPSLPVTIATHGNIARDKHINQCRTWHGPIVAAMYLALIQPGGAVLNRSNQQIVQDTVHQLDKVHRRIEQHRKCQLTIMLFWEVFASANDSWLYPTNDMRNLALTQARTPMVAMIDIDLLISVGLSHLLADPSKAREIQTICDNRGVVSLAAFQFPTSMDLTHASRLVDRLVQGTKKDITHMVKGQHHLIPFAADVFPAGHNVTNYTRWYSASRPYRVQYVWHYEPWYIIARRANPFYDTRFRAYFYNKVMHAAHVNSTGMRIIVHPDAYIMHRPHPVSKVYSSRALFGRLHTIMYDKSEAFKDQMAAGGYEPAAGPAATRCVAELPWWTDPQYDYQDPANWVTGDGAASGAASPPGRPAEAAQARSR